MKIQFKKQLIYWANIILLTLNITFLVYSFSYDRKTQEVNDTEISNEFIMQELEFTSEQIRQMNEVDQNIQYKYQLVLKLLCQNRYGLLHELSKPYPSELELDSIAETIGFLHRALKKQTIEHLLNLKKICTNEQSEQLNIIFRRVLEMDRYCPLCNEKCSFRKKNERYPVFFPYDHEAEKKMKEQLNQPPNGKRTL